VDVSRTGRLVAFTSEASNVVADDDNELADVLVRDRHARTTTLVSAAPDGTVGNSQSGSPSISANRRYVAFDSFASDLVDGEDEPLTSDIFVRDLETGLTTAVSVDVDGAAPDGPSFSPAISAAGTRVTFWSSASDLVPGDANGFDDIFVRDLAAGTTERVSVSTTGGTATR